MSCMDGASWSQHKERRIRSSKTKVTANAFVRQLEIPGEIPSMPAMWQCCGDRETGRSPIHRLQQAVASGGIQERNSHSSSQEGTRHTWHLKDPSAHVPCISTRVPGTHQPAGRTRGSDNQPWHPGGYSDSVPIFLVQ